MNVPKNADFNRPPDPREISKWVRIYAQNRTLGELIWAGIFVLVFLGWWVLPLCIKHAGASGNSALLWLAIVALACVAAGNLIIAVPGWSSKLIARINDRVYASEGNVAIEPDCKNRARWPDVMLAIGFAICILAFVAFGDLIEPKYQQPVTALYFVPFSIAFILRHPRAGHLQFLAPLLYAWHAVLIVLGAPIVFSGQLSPLNIVLPTMGYIMLTRLLMHLYSRVALHKLRAMAQAGYYDNGSEAEVSDNG